MFRRPPRTTRIDTLFPSTTTCRSVDRPIFAAVLSIIIFVVGLIAIPLLPVSEYPEVVPPSVQVRATYPGANPREIADTVAAPLEASITGVENMLRSEEHTSELQSLMRISYAVFCLHKKTIID